MEYMLQSTSVLMHVNYEGGKTIMERKFQIKLQYFIMLVCVTDYQLTKCA
jgi:hypothetical protein